MTLCIDGRQVGRGQRTFVIAEIGVNHDGSVDRALELVDHAAAGGADAVKLQIFTADSLMNESAAFADYQRQAVSEQSPAAMLRNYELNESDCARVVRRIKQREMIPLATPFSPNDVAIIQKLDLPAIKIASPDLINRVLLHRAAGAGRPIIVSTGAATLEEVATSVEWLRHWKAEFALMHCVSSYPTPADDAHLCWINELANLGVPVGYSDHTTLPLAGALAVAAGACIVEKHLTYDRAAAGPDHAASADPWQFAEYIRHIRAAEKLLGSPGKHVLPIEQDVRNVSRQSLVLIRDISAGELIHQDDLTVQRPGTGILPAELEAAAGRIAKIPLRKGTLLQWNMLSDAA